MRSLNSCPRRRVNTRRDSTETCVTEHGLGATASFWDSTNSIAACGSSWVKACRTMIRVIYRWRVPSELQDDFVCWWHKGTDRIRSTRTGARGSTLFGSESDRGQCIAIARWESLEALTTFWDDPDGARFGGAELVAVEVLHEIDHLTVEEW